VDIPHGSRSLRARAQHVILSQVVISCSIWHVHDCNVWLDVGARYAWALHKAPAACANVHVRL